MRPQAGQVEGSEQTLLLHLEHKYPPLVGREWHAHRLFAASTIREGKPIISRLLLPATSSSLSSLPSNPVLLLAAVTGGVVVRMISSR